MEKAGMLVPFRVRAEARTHLSKKYFEFRDRNQP